MRTFMENLWHEKIIQDYVTHDTTEGFIIEGECFHVAPFNQRTTLEIDAPQGSIGGLFIGFLSQLGKWGFHREKVEEWIEVSPAHAEYYQMTIQQKQQLEGQIKAGFAGISTAVSDFELLFHDVRKYEEFLEYFEDMERGKKEKKPELVQEAEQSFKAIFIDQVDVHTGEGIALKLIAPRWPTIIADFMKLEDEDTMPEKIAEKLKVSEAEGVVLATKNKLYKEWREDFKDIVMDRYGRLRSLMEARRRSIEEYINMVKPYIARYRYIRELGETPEGRKTLESLSWLRPAGKFVAVSGEYSTIWAWRAFAPPELYKAGAEAASETKSIFKIGFPSDFKEWAKRDYKKIEEKFSKVKTSPTGIEPLDKWVMGIYPLIEKHYKIKFSLSDILEARNTLIDQYSTYEWNWVKSPYFMTFEMPVARLTFHIQGGGETESIVFQNPRNYVDTQNVILLRLLEIKAREMELENYIAEMVGEKAGAPVQTIKEMIKGELPHLFGEGEKPEEKKEEKKPQIADFLRRKLGLNLRLFKPGKYETAFDDRITGPYMREIGQYLYTPYMKYWKGAFGVPGF